MSGQIVAVALPPWGQEVRINDENRHLIITHEPDRCAGSNCCLHNPSDHPLNEADMILRLDKFALVERRCEHGVGHDDPDSVAWLKTSLDKDGIESNWVGVHGCDGCCSTRRSEKREGDE